MMVVITALLAGLLFGAGLLVSGMTNPAKVVGFLDVAGAWDPSLAFVMGGAVVTTTIGYRVLRGWDRPLLAARFQWPTRTDLDVRLIAGAALFSIGWGLAGYCPGPAVTVVTIAAPAALVFLPAMLVGMVAARLVQAPPTVTTPASPTPARPI